jgi:hypothetical protein
LPARTPGIIADLITGRQPRTGNVDYEPRGEVAPTRPRPGALDDVATN